MSTSKVKSSRRGLPRKRGKKDKLLPSVWLSGAAADDSKAWNKAAKENSRRARANKITNMLGGKGTNLSTGSTDSVEGIKEILRVANMEDQMPVVATINDRSLAVLSAGIVLSAIKGGWMIAIKNGENPYYAFRYMFEVFLTSLSNAPPLNTGAPIWFWELLAALKPKLGAFKTGTVSYTWLVQPSSFPVTPIWQYASIPTRAICWGTASTTTVNGYPVVTPAVDSAYTTELGSASFVSMCNFLPQTSLNQSVVSVPNPFWEKDTSAFSVTYPELGSSLDTSGALALTIYSERVIDSPILAKFALYQPVGEYYRGWHKAGKSALSSCYIGSRLMEFESMKEARDKISPILVMFNFDEFFYALSLILGQAIQLANESVTSPVVSCPLTSQETQILLRQSILGIFANHMAQDIFLQSPLDQLTAFSVGPNGVPQSGGKMLLPTVLAENIRCSQRRIKKLPMPGGVEAIFDIVSVLTRPSNQPQLQNFTVPGTAQLVYSVEPTEVAIDIIDMSAVVGNTMQYLTPSGTVYDMQVAVWNAWITTLASNLSPLVQMTSQPGIAALSTVLFTRSVVDNAVDLKKNVVEKKTVLTKKDSEKKIPKLTDLQKMKERFGFFMSGPEQPVYLDNFIDKEIIANQPVAGPIWQYLNNFILPVLMTEVENGQASVQAWKTFQIQPYTIADNTIAGGEGNVDSIVFPMTVNRLARLATLDVKATNQQQYSEAVQDIVKQTEKGNGGLFASLAGLAADLFVPGAGSTVSGAVSSFGL